MRLIPSNPVGNPRFFASTGPHALTIVAAAVGCEPPVSDLLLSGLASLEAAGPDQPSFLGGARHAPVFEQSRAGAVLVSADLQGRVPPGTMALAVTDPLAGWAQAAALFHPVPTAEVGIHSSAVVAETAIIDPSAEIGALAYMAHGRSSAHDAGSDPGR